MPDALPAIRSAAPSIPLAAASVIHVMDLREMYRAFYIADRTSRPLPRTSFRAPPELRAKAEQRAAREGKTVSQLAREAFEKYLAS